MIIETRNQEETFAFGREIGKRAKPGQIYTLVGDLGVGKTVFTQGVAAGLCIEEPISSPTFTIIQEYVSGRLPFYHFDVYRIGDVEEMEEIGYDDYFRKGHLPDRVGESHRGADSGGAHFHNDRKRFGTGIRLPAYYGGGPGRFWGSLG